MKVKKIVLVICGLLIVVGLIAIFILKPMTMNEVYNKPNFSGVVLEVNDGSILVAVNDSEKEFKSSDKISVSLDVKVKYSVANFDIGDEVKVFYDGEILESYPAQIHKTYAVLLQNDK